MSRRARITYPHVASTLAVVLALGTGGAYASSLAKNSVGTKQLKNGAVQAADVRSGTLTGTQVGDNSLTGADVDESTLTFPPAPPAPPAPTVIEGPYTYNATLSSTWKTYATATFTAPVDGYARIEAEATLGANPAATPGGYIDTLFYIDDDGKAPYGAVGAYTLWGSPDPTGVFVQHPTASDVVAVKAGTYVVTFEMREHLTSNNSSLQNAQIDVQFFPKGSAQPDA